MCKDALFQRFLVIWRFLRTATSVTTLWVIHKLHRTMARPSGMGRLHMQAASLLHACEFVTCRANRMKKKSWFVMQMYNAEAHLCLKECQQATEGDSIPQMSLLHPLQLCLQMGNT